LNLEQAALLGELSPHVSEAARRFSTASTNERGAVFTRREVVEFILDLVGYTEDRPLGAARLLEPAAGHGDFLLPVVGRLIRSFVARGGDLAIADKALGNAITAYEVHENSLVTARTAVGDALQAAGVTASVAQALVDRWLVPGDFLLAPLSPSFSHVVGNPPYVRQELIPDELLAEYRARFRTLYDRADLYIPFYERSLDLLAPGGRLGFICTDRWTKNKYGGPLRGKIAAGFALMHFIDLVDTPAFLADVMTYPAITVIERPARRSRRATRVAYRPALDQASLTKLARALTAPTSKAAAGVVEMHEVALGSEPWLLHDAERLALVRRLEATFFLLEDAGCKVGIGVATGNDGVYIAPLDDLDVEPSRKLPLVRTHDLRQGRVDWQGMGVLNPFNRDGTLVSLNRYPRFAAYLERHGAAIKARNVAKRHPDRWYRTIDRIYPELASQPKLLIPDIKGDAHVVYESGEFYPHHNLYYITATAWDLHALQAVLMSGIALLFVGAYCTPMRGGFLRFQAQYLRRIRVPRWEEVPKAQRRALIEAGRTGRVDLAQAAAFDLYSLTSRESEIVANV
jgi:hypothetical protein